MKGILLVAFGMLQSNSTIWHTVTMLNGYCLIVCDVHYSRLVFLMLTDHFSPIHAAVSFNCARHSQSRC